MASTTKPMTHAETRAFVMDYMKAWNDHDVEAILTHLTDDVIWLQPAMLEPVHGKAAARTALEDSFRAFPDMHFPLEDTEVFFCEDPSKAIATWTHMATMTGRLAPGYEPTGKAVRASGTCTYKFRDGLISEHTILFDGLTYLQRAGLLPTEQGITFKVMLEGQNLFLRAKKALHR